METIHEETTLEMVLKELEKEEQVEALYYLVNRLPEFASTIRSMEDKLAFLGSVLEDKQALNTIGQELEERVEKLHFNQEHFDALVEFVHLMPRIVPLVKKLDEVAEFINTLITDKKSLEYVVRGLNDVVPIEKGIEIIQETNERFKADTTTQTISLLGMYRLLKDPIIQNAFKYLGILLEVVRKK